MNHFIKIVQCAKLSLTNHFFNICNNNPPIEIINIIMQLLADTLRVSIHCHKKKYYLLMNTNVYGIPYEECTCHNLYKVANMTNVKKIVYGCNHVYFITYNNVLYSKSHIESRDSGVKKMMSNVVDIKYGKSLYILTTDKRVLKIVDNKQHLIFSNVSDFNCCGHLRVAIINNKCHFSVGNSTKILSLDFNVVSSKSTQIWTYFLTDDGVIYSYDFYHNKLNIITLPKIVKMEAHKNGIAFLDVNHQVHIIGTFGGNSFNTPKLIDINNVIDVKCEKRIMLLTKDLSVYITAGHTIEKIFSFTY